MLQYRNAVMMTLKSSFDKLVLIHVILPVTSLVMKLSDHVCILFQSNVDPQLTKILLKSR